MNIKKQINNKILEISKEFPDIRYGQILCNAMPSNDPFYLTDQQLLDLLTISYRKLKERNSKCIK
jgi:hypothetical protein